MVMLMLFATSLFLFGLWWSKLQNRYVVNPNNRERLVLKNSLTGAMKVLGPGAWFEFPWWQLLETVDLNREPTIVSGKGEPIKASDGPSLNLQYRYDLVAGRRFDEKTGALLGDPNGTYEVSAEAVILAVTRIDFSNRKARAAEFVQAANEAILGNYKANQLLLPDKDKQDEILYVPLQRIEGNSMTIPPIPDIEPLEVTNASELYERLAECIEREANRMLTFVGINITGFKILNLEPADAELQKDIEKRVSYGHITNAVQDLVETSGNTISYREALVADSPEALGPVATAEATRDAAESISNALTEGLKTLGAYLKSKGGK